MAQEEITTVSRRQQDGTHYPPKYIIKPLEVCGFVKGKCFICGEKCPDDFYCHYECANALQQKKKEILDSFLKKDRK